MLREAPCFDATKRTKSDRSGGPLQSEIDDSSDATQSVRRVLHLEDNREDQELIEYLLSRAGIVCDITTVES
jgi:hypothetical protein